MKNYFTLFLIQTLSFCLFSQVQKGNTLEGSATQDYSGYSISMPTNDILAVGSNSDLPERIYEYNGGAWGQKGSDLPGALAGDASGYSIHMPDSLTVAIGSPAHSSYTGLVRIFKWDGNDWIQKGNGINGSFSDDYFGVSVNMSDSNTIAIGSPQINFGTGYTQIYDWNGSAWVQRGNDLTGLNWDDWFGHFVSMPNANTIAIGDPKNDFTGIDAGLVQVFEWTGATWQQKGSALYGAIASDSYGHSLDMPNQNTLIVGAAQDGAAGGYVNVYTWNGNNWIQKGTSVTGASHLGASVSMPDDNHFTTGDHMDFTNGFQSGQAKVYEWSGTSWVQKGNAVNGSANGDWFGWSVAMPDSTTFGVGAPNNDSPGLLSGEVRVYQFCDTIYQVTESVTACNSYTWIDGNTYTSDNDSATHVLTAVTGCDSIITLNLTIDSVADISTTLAGITITANNTNATCAWLDCDDSFAIIPGENNQNYMPTANGNYAVELTENGCVDTSDCVAITTVGIIENSFIDEFTLYPNPTNGLFSIEFISFQEHVTLTIMDASGKLVDTKLFDQVDLIEYELNQPKGIYLIEVSDSEDQQSLIRLIKQ